MNQRLISNPQNPHEKYGENHRNPETKKGGKGNGGKILAKIVLGLTILSSAAYFGLKTEAGKNLLNTANEIKSGDVSQDLFTRNRNTSDISFNIDECMTDPDNPNVLNYKEGDELREIEYKVLSEDEVIVAQKGASFRNSPEVGDNHNNLVTTQATANRKISFDNIKNYCISSNPKNFYEDQFLGINASDLTFDMKIEMGIGSEVKIVWIRLDPDHSEIAIEKRADLVNGKTDEASTDMSLAA